jgi:curved DNA-binding protein CbpA
MAERFEAGYGGLLAALSRIQTASASARLTTEGDPATELHFQHGLLTEVRLVSSKEDAPAAGTLPEDLRGRAAEALNALVLSGSRITVEPVEDAATPADLQRALNAADLSLDLAKSADVAWVTSRLGGPAVRPDRNPTPPRMLPAVAVGPGEAFLVNCANGSTSLREILKLSPLDPSETLRALYGLLAVGLLVVRPAAAEARATAGKGATNGASPAPPAGDVARPAAVGSTKGTPPQPQKARGKKASALDDFLKKTKEAAAGTPSTPPAEASSYVLSPEQEEERARVEAWISEVRNADHYTILNVDRTADEAAVRHAYYKIAKLYHPDHHQRPEFEDIFREIERTFAAVTEAYNTLTDAGARAEYERNLAAALSGPRKADVDKAALARDSFLRARKHLEEAEFFDALRLLEEACKADPKKEEYWNCLASVQEKNPRWRKKAEESYLKAIELNPGNAQNYLSLGRLYKSGNLARRAAEMFQNVLQWDPENEEALQELGRKKKGEPGQGVAGRIRSIFGGPKS